MQSTRSEAGAATAPRRGQRRCSSASSGLREAVVSFAEAHAGVRSNGHATSEARRCEVIETGGGGASSTA